MSNALGFLVINSWPREFQIFLLFKRSNSLKGHFIYPFWSPFTYLIFLVIPLRINSLWTTDRHNLSRRTLDEYCWVVGTGLMWNPTGTPVLSIVVCSLLQTGRHTGNKTQYTSPGQKCIELLCTTRLIDIIITRTCAFPEENYLMLSITEKNWPLWTVNRRFNNYLISAFTEKPPSYH